MERIKATDTAKLVRKALKEAFPNTKFSVRTDSYSGGASIDIKWTDGPTSKQVKAITDRFEGATFDGMQDLKEYHRSTLDGREVSFGADFIFTKRGTSEKLIAKAYDRVANKYAWVDEDGDRVTAEELPTPEWNDDGYLANARDLQGFLIKGSQSYTDSLYDTMNRKASELTLEVAQDSPTARRVAQ